jgi:shikimate dehydrogenase
MIPIQVSPDGLGTLLGGLRRMRNLEGFIVTVPHKGAMLSHCDTVSEAGRQSEAVNAVRRLPDGRFAGTMLDGEGFITGLRSRGIEPAGVAAYLAGAGGAANAIAFALAKASVSRLTIANRTRARAEALAARVSAAYPQVATVVGGPDPAGHGLVINATSLGLAEGDPLPIDVSGLTADQTVAEIIMWPEVTPLLAAAAGRGARTHPGLPMLLGQAELMADYLGMTA